ncbi:hypothetical protein EVAR_102747_1 [Eumeta japonica]|uniref:Uncharacterized protein n=1 Tax=Eumeta variegata TaxID=151549 RepID=A0A4C1TKU3_EUMVA|nr:hypothetical protein EVAR_102747_1 [Eumeta japonica]
MYAYIPFAHLTHGDYLFSAWNVQRNRDVRSATGAEVGANGDGDGGEGGRRAGRVRRPGRAQAPRPAARGGQRRGRGRARAGPSARRPAGRAAATPPTPATSAPLLQHASNTNF